MGLFVENLTLLFLGAALLTALCSLGNKSARLPLWAGFLGSALAAAIIFGGGSFSQLLLEGSALNGLRDLTFDWSGGLPAALTGILEQYFVRLLPISFLRGPHIALPSASGTAGSVPWRFWGFCRWVTTGCSSRLRNTTLPFELPSAP